MESIALVIVSFFGLVMGAATIDLCNVSKLPKKAHPLVKLLVVTIVICVVMFTLLVIVGAIAHILNTLV